MHVLRPKIYQTFCSNVQVLHTFCSRFCERETNVKVIQAVMGHADITTTMNIYAEVTDAAKIESFENLSRNINVF